MSLFVARNGHERRAGECPLLEEERKSRLRPLTSELTESGHRLFSDFH
jgi:hypothetical protein